MMFCARCGQQIPDATEICPLCGREATIKVPPPPAVAQTAVAPALAPNPPQVSAPSSAPIRSDLQGVRGWLLLFCVGIVLLGPLLTLTQVINLPGADVPGMVLEFARVAFGVVVGVFVWNKRPVAFTLLWIYFGIVAVIGVLGIIGSAVTAEQGADRDLMLSIRYLIYIFVWFLYFRRSERVRATFGRNL